MAIHGIHQNLLPPPVTRRPIGDIQYWRNMFRSKPGFVDHVIDQLGSHKNLHDKIEEVLLEVKLIQALQTSVPHTNNGEDIDYAFDMVVDKLEEVLQHIVSHAESIWGK